MMPFRRWPVSAPSNYSEKIFKKYMPITRRLPEHLRKRPSVARKLRRWITEMSNFYRLPVYLCGSALFDFNTHPRDWDVRIEMPDDEFARRFGPWGEWEEQGGSGDWGPVRWKWSDECVKRSKGGWLSTGLNIDFQIYPVSHCVGYRRRLKLRMDRTRWRRDGTR